MKLKCDDNSYIGHRKRLVEKFTAHPSSLFDYELIELLLFYVFPRKNTKKLAKVLLNDFKTIHRIIFAECSELKKINGLGTSTSTLFAVVREIFSNMLLEKVAELPVITSSSQVVDYYTNILGSLKKEQLRVLFLNNKNRLISEEVLQTGTVNSTAVYPREIIHKALERGATAMILVHNHPSGDSTPSRQDIILTRTIKDISQKLDLTLLDHLVIGGDGAASFKELGLI